MNLAELLRAYANPAVRAYGSREKGLPALTNAQYTGLLLEAADEIEPENEGPDDDEWIARIYAKGATTAENKRPGKE